MKLVLTINKTHIHADYVNGTVIELMGIDEINRVAVGLRYACVTLSYTRRVADLGGAQKGRWFSADEFGLWATRCTGLSPSSPYKYIYIYIYM